MYKDMYLIHMVSLKNITEKEVRIMRDENSKKNNKQKTRKMSLRFKIVIPVSLLILIICCGMGISSYFSTNSGMVNMGVD